jgi:hypothetical protein
MGSCAVTGDESSTEPAIAPANPKSTARWLSLVRGFVAAFDIHFSPKIELGVERLNASS